MDISDFEDEYFAYFESKGFRDAEGRPIGDDPKFCRMVNTSASLLRRWHLATQRLIEEDPEFAEYLEGLREISLQNPQHAVDPRSVFL